MHQMIFYHTVVLFIKIRKNGVPMILNNMANSEFAYSTRSKSSGNFKVCSRVKVPNDLSVRSFRWRSVECWNVLPSSIKSIENDNQFKKSLKEWIRENIGINP